MTTLSLMNSNDWNTLKLSLDFAGEVLATIDTRQMNNTYSAVSPCGRFVGSAGGMTIKYKYLNVFFYSV